MKKRITALLIAAIFMIIPQQHSKALPTANPTVRVGLYYASTALISANLQNYENTGSGYRFGYLDSNMQFIEVGRTAETKITMIKNKNVYLENGTYAETGTSNAKIVGSYHEPVSTHANFQEANNQVTSLRSAGKAAFVCYDKGIWNVRASSYSTNTGNLVSGSQYAISVVVTGTNDIIFQFDGGANTHLTVMPDVTGHAAPQTWFKGYRYFGGFEYRRFTGDNLTVSSVVNLQQYVKGIIPYEMSPSWPLEALKAQAVCARTYSAFNLGRHKSSGFDLCSDDFGHCQVYKGNNNATAVTNQAVDETNGVYITYNNDLCNTVYHSSNGGSTENSENVWSMSTPYLRAVVDPYEDLAKATHGIWTFTYTNAQLTSLLNSKGVSNAGVKDFYVEEYTPSGNVLKVTFVDTNNKKYSYTKETARTFLNNSSMGINTYSQRYSINSGSSSLSAKGQNGTNSVSGTLYAVGAGGVVQAVTTPIKILTANGIVDAPTSSQTSNGTYQINGRGWGHNVGLSQWGARGMAEKSFTYDKILTFYFTSIAVSQSTN